MIGVRTSALAALLVLSGHAWADPASEALIRDFIQGIDDSPDWAASVTSVRSDGDDTLVDGLSFARQAPAVSITIGTLRLRDLAARAGGGFSVSEMEAGDMALNAEGVEMKAPSATATELAVPTLPALVTAPKDILKFSSDLYSALAAAKLGDFTIPETTIVQHMPPDDASSAVTTATYNNIHFGGMSGGLLSHSDLGPVSIAVEVPGGPSTQFQIEKVEAERTDFSAIAHVLNEAEYSGGTGDGVWRSAIARLRYSGLTGSGGDNATFHLDEASIDNVDVRQPPRPFVTRLQGLQNVQDNNPAQVKLALETVNDVIAAVRIGAIRFGGIGIDAPGDQGGQFHLADMTTLGISSRGIDSFELRDLGFAAPQAVGTLQSIELAGLTFPDLTAYSDLIGMDPNLTDKATRNAAIRKAIEGLPQLKRFKIAGLSAGQSEDQQVSLDNMALTFDKFVGPFPTVGNFGMQALTIPGELLRLEPQAREVFDALGLSQLVLGMTASDTWDNTSGQVESKLALAVKDVGETSLDYMYSGVTEDWVVEAIAAAADSPGESDTQAALKVLDGLSFNGATVTVTDRSFLDKAFGYAAQKQGLTLGGAAYREQMRGAVPFMLSAALSPDLAKLVSAPLQAFLAGNQTLVIEAKPAAAIPVPALAEAIERDPMSVPALLNLSFRSEPAKPLP